ncbi:MAG: hypothetical protein LC114_18660 [Bryobacterales bacterium]|nr:hypothetical protein [Bryobacterales bacterium]
MTALFRLLAGLVITSTCLLAQVQILPLKDVRAGMKGTGRTVFSGSKVGNFDAEILGVIENASPGQSIILARLSGGPLAETGVLQGMSGSPVYVEGKLIGAVALGFAFSKEPICGIRPIEEMIAAGSAGSAPGVADRRIRLGDTEVAHVFSEPASVLAGTMRLSQVRTPLELSGFTEGTLKEFGPTAARLGLELAQGFSGGGHAAAAPVGGKPEPGSMISVQLMRGDMQVAADGTVTYVDGNRLYAFGHRFLGVGGTSLPFATSEVLAVLPNVSSSFKITRSGTPLGVIEQDRSVTVSGTIGAKPDLAPFGLRVQRETASGVRLLEKSYRMEMVKDAYLSPLLLQMAIFSAVDATERSVGAATISLDATLRFADGVPPLRIRNQFSGTSMVSLAAALNVAVPVGYALQSGFDELKLEGVDIEVVSYEKRRELNLDQVWASSNEAEPGEDIEIHALLIDEGGNPVRQRFQYTIPRGAPAGPLFFSVTDAASLNMLDLGKLTSVVPRNPKQLVDVINSIRGNGNLYLRVWRQEPTYSIQGADLPAPPPSAALILDRSTDVKGGRNAVQNAAVAEMSANMGSFAVSGSRTIRVDVKSN